MNPSHLTLVAGATGLLGGEIVRQLRGRDAAVRALVRTPATDATMQAQGVEVAQGDLKDPASLARACAGVKCVVSTCTAIRSRREGDSLASVDDEGHRNLIDAARRAGATHFVFVSFPPNGLDYPLQRAKRAVESHLRASSLTWTILHPVNFMEVWLSPALGFDPLAGRARVFGDGTRPVSWVSFRDVARFAVAATFDEHLAGRTLPLGGPDALAPSRVIQIFEELGAPKVNVDYVPEAALEEQLRSATDPLAQSYAASMLSTARGQLVEMTATLQLVQGSLRTVRSYATELLRASQGRMKQGVKHSA